MIRTPDQRLRVFVSSTLTELAPERDAARAAIESLRLAPVMFELGARPYPPRDLYRAYLEQSHVFVGIYGQRYGWVAPGETISGLEDEYRLSGALPRLIYLKRTDVDREPRLEALMTSIRADAAASYRWFSTADELRDLITDDLALLLAERFEVHGGLDADRQAGARTNLPVPRNPIVGREAELATAIELLRRGETSLLSLLGPGGCGKSRLALEIALRLQGVFDDGAYLVPLETLRDPRMVLPAIATTLRLPAAPERAAVDQLADELGSARLLLLLDNLEQVRSAGPDISTLLQRCPHLVILATSRAPLRIRGERTMAIAPLPVPAVGAADPATASNSAAVALFVQRAQAVEPGFSLTAANTPIVAEICRRLDGLPLAIELAAARLRLLAPSELLARLARRLDVLRGGTQDQPERQQTLRRTIDWSFELLDDPARAVFCRLSVFDGGSTLEAAEAVARDDTLGVEPLDVIASLLDDSMLVGSIGELGDTRIGMLETIREYAAERLRASGDLDSARRAHAAWYAGVAERAGVQLFAADEPAWTARVDAERGNIRVALEWCDAEDPELGLRIAGDIWRFWETRGPVAEASAWFARLLAHPGPASATRAKALHAASGAAAYLGDFATARTYVRQCLAIARKHGDRRGVAAALNDMGIVESRAGRYREARRRLEAALAIKRELGDPWAIANGLTNLGLLAIYGGEAARAEELHREALAIYRSQQDQLGVAVAIGNVAHTAMLQGRLEEARAGQVDSLRRLSEIGDLDGCAESLERLAMVANATGAHARAAGLFGLASELHDRAGVARGAFERAEAEREISATRAALGADRFERAWDDGRQSSLEAALSANGIAAGWSVQAP